MANDESEGEKAARLEKYERKVATVVLAALAAYHNGYEVKVSEGLMSRTLAAVRHVWAFPRETPADPAARLLAAIALSLGHDMGREG